MDFSSAALRVKNLTKKPSDDIMLQIYALYKQATVGDINTAYPSFWDIVGKAKWNAWKTLEGTNKETAETTYITLVQSLLDSDKLKK